MRIRDYFSGIPVRLTSPRPPQEVAERINDAAGSTWWPFNTGVVGRVWLKQVKLRYASSFGEYNAKPVLVGPIVESPSGSTLILTYRSPTFFIVFHVFWYLFLTLVAVLFVSTALFVPQQPPITWLDGLLAIGVFAAMFVLPILMHYFGTRNSDAELQYLLDFLAEQVDARPAQPRPV